MFKRVLLQYVDFHAVIKFFKKREGIVVLLILLAACVLRLSYFDTISVGFDQVQILQQAREILSGNLTLIGPRTGPANMFTGPLIYYMAAVFVFVGSDAAALVVLPIFIAAVTWLVGYYILKQQFGIFTATLLLVIWAFSPLFAAFDRILWNPDLTPLAALLIFSQLFAEKESKYAPYYLFFGAFFAYQAHFSGVLLVALAVLFLLIFKRKKGLFLGLIAGAFVSVLPTVVFDMRNNFLNLRGLVGLVTTGTSETAHAITNSLFETIHAVMRLFGSVVLHGSGEATIVLAGLSICLIGLFLLKEAFLKRFSFSVLFVIVAYTLYGGEKPEYYFFILLPPFLFLLAAILRTFRVQSLVMTVLFFMLYGTVTAYIQQRTVSGSTLATIQNIQAFAVAENVSEVVYDLQHGRQFGLQYFLSGLSYNPTGSKLHIVDTGVRGIPGTIPMGGLAVWLDRRPADRNSVTGDGYFLVTHPEYFLYKDQYPKFVDEEYDRYLVVHKEAVVGIVSVARYNPNILDWRVSCAKVLPKAYAVWQETGLGQYLYFNQVFCVKVESTQEALILSELDLQLL